MAAFPHITNKLSVKSTKTSTPQAFVVQYLDGYSQRITRGPAEARHLESWTIVFEQVTELIMIDVVNALTDIGTWDTFDWTPPHTGVSKKFRVVGSWTHSSLHDNNHTITFNVTQEFC